METCGISSSTSQNASVVSMYKNKDSSYGSLSARCCIINWNWRLKTLCSSSTFLDSWYQHLSTMMSCCLRQYHMACVAQFTSCKSFPGFDFQDKNTVSNPVLQVSVSKWTTSVFWILITSRQRSSKIEDLLSSDHMTYVCSGTANQRQGFTQHLCNCSSFTRNPLMLLSEKFFFVKAFVICDHFVITLFYGNFLILVTMNMQNFVTVLYIYNPQIYK